MLHGLMAILTAAAAAAASLYSMVVVDPGTGMIGEGTTLTGASTGAIAMITKIGIEGIEADEIDVSTMNSGGYKQFARGMKDAKQLTLELVYEKTTAKKVIDALNSATEVWTIVFPDLSTYVVSGFVKQVGIQVPFGDKMTVSVTIRLTSSPVFNAHS